LRTSGSGSARSHRSFNTTARTPSLDASVSTAAVARSLEVQYGLGGGADASTAQASGNAVATGPAGGRPHASSSSGGCSAPTIAPSLASSCAALCIRHCAKVQQGRGETTVLDINCGVGGACFALAVRWAAVGQSRAGFHSSVHPADATAAAV
jgi:hypothetical protein